MAAQSSPVQSPLQPLDIIFSCNICHDSIKDIDKNLKDGQDRPGDSRKPIAKLWMTECAHLVCAKHLEGGAPPFHPAGEAPRAVCPVCVARQNFRGLRAMYAINGFSKDDHDAAIPDHFFQCPPVSLSAKEGGMDALRFQFLSLVTYGIASATKTRNLEASNSRMKDQMERLKEEKDQISTQAEALAEQVKSLEKAARKREEKDPEISHYLAQYSAMKKELDRRYEDLHALGYNATRIDFSFPPFQKGVQSSGGRKSVHTEQTNAANATNQDAFASRDVPSVSSTTLRADSANTCDEEARIAASKRQKISDFQYVPKNPQQSLGRPVRGEQAKAMLPPEYPASKMSPPKGYVANQAAAPGFRNPDHIGTRDNLVEQDLPRKRFRPPVSDNRESRTGLDHVDAPYMSGALQAGDLRITDIESQYFENATPTSRIEPVDDLSDISKYVHDVPVDGPRYAQTSYRSEMPTAQSRNLNRDYQQHYHDSMPTRGVPVHDSQLPYRSNHVSRDGGHQGTYQNSRRQTPAYRSPVKQRIERPATPSPQRFGGFRMSQNSSVTSPFWHGQKSGEYALENNFPSRAQSNHAMQPPQIPSHRRPTASSRTLNGLSFNELPYIKSNQQTPQSQGTFQPSDYRQSYAIPRTPRDSQGLLQRSDMMRESAGSSYRPSQPRPLPSANPSLSSSLNISRSRRGLPEDESLASMRGVKGATAVPAGSDGLYHSARNVFSSSGRRKMVR